MHKLIDKFHEACWHASDKLTRVAIFRHKKWKIQIRWLLQIDCATFFLQLGINCVRSIHDEVADEL